MRADSFNVAPHLLPQLLSLAREHILLQKACSLLGTNPVVATCNIRPSILFVYALLVLIQWLPVRVLLTGRYLAHLLANEEVHSPEERFACVQLLPNHSRKGIHELLSLVYYP